MVEHEKISKFINYNYTPFDKKQCLKRLFIVWITSVALSLLGEKNIPWMLMLGLIDLSISIMFITLMARYNQLQIARYLCDGIFYLYMSVTLNLASYRIMAIQNGSNWMLATILMSLLMICICIFVYIVFLNIKSENYSEKSIPKRTISLQCLGGIVGVFVARSLLPGQSQQEALTLLSYMLLILSFIMGIPSITLLKALFCKKYIKE